MTLLFVFVGTRLLFLSRVSLNCFFSSQTRMALRIETSTEPFTPASCPNGCEHHNHQAEIKVDQPRLIAALQSAQAFPLYVLSGRLEHSLKFMSYDALNQKAKLCVPVCEPLLEMIREQQQQRQQGPRVERQE